MANSIAWVQCRICSGVGFHPYARRFPESDCRFCDGVGWYDVERRAKAKSGSHLDPRKGQGTYGKHIEPEPVTEKEPTPVEEPFQGLSNNVKPYGDQGKGHARMNSPGSHQLSSWGRGKGSGGQGRYQVVRSSPDCIVIVALPRTPLLTEQMP
jgi:hypothetical protein